MLIFAATLLACDPRLREETLVAKPPLQEARIRGKILYVRLLPGVRLDFVVSVPVAPLRPGMRVNEAQHELGAPTAMRHAGDGTFYQFAGVSPEVELAHWTGPGSDGKPWFRWVVMGRPSDRPPDQVLRPAVADLLKTSDGVAEIVIHEAEKNNTITAFTALYREGRLRYIHWYRIPAVESD